VFVEHLTIANSVEQRILSLQKEKQKIADAALDGAKQISSNRLSINDFRVLFGINDNNNDNNNNGNYE